MIILKNIIEEICGNVILTNFFQLLAPSISAASYRSAGTFFRAARNITKEDPNVHSCSRMIVGNAVLGSPSQCRGGRWIAFNRELIIPSSWNISFQRMAIPMLPPIRDGI